MNLNKKLKQKHVQKWKESQKNLNKLKEIAKHLLQPGQEGYILSPKSTRTSQNQGQNPDQNPYLENPKQIKKSRKPSKKT